MSQAARAPIPLTRPQRLPIVIAAPAVSADLAGRLEDSSGAGAAGDAGGTASNLDVRALVSDAAHLEQAIARSGAQVAFIHQHLPNARADLGTYILQTCGVPCILLVDETLRGVPDLLTPHKSPFPPGIVAEARRAGFLEVAGWPPVPAELQLVANLAQDELARTGSRTRLSAGAALRDGRIIALHSGIDGVGTTEMAINIAALLAHGGKRVALVDLHLSGANLHRKLHIAAPPNATGMHLLTETELAASGAGDAHPPSRGPWDDDTLIDLAPYIISYPAPDEPSWTAPTRLEVLLGIEDADVARRFGADTSGALRLQASLRARYDVAVLDLGTRQSPAHVVLAAHVDDLVVVTTPLAAEVELVAAAHARLAKATGLPAERRHVLVNRMGDPAYQMSLVEIAARLDRADDILGAVAEDMALVRRARARAYPPPALEPGRDGTRGASGFRRDLEQVVTRLVPGSIPPRSDTAWDRSRALGRVRDWALSWRGKGAPQPVSGPAAPPDSQPAAEQDVRMAAEQDARTAEGMS